ncbi:hypothetical protein KFE96_02140 [Kordiimonas sp. SCSIO 12603]|uniref:hypothetical protein n=1 Tax=Kordiimonas sp. SCSIO 12603 TaxID=2829596 RepID=UPI0021021E36|nr:hypothetical protein [Kordiimonas sp. SCSIO 12603]UTW59130.1 hypothetical protein KFE96_02140 [Kordiimonas sp. SCSIO 12603]
MKHILLSTLIFISSPASADIATGWKAYEKGNYEEALHAATLSTEKERYALGCLAGVAQGGTIDKGQLAVKTLHLTIESCTEAFKIDPDNFKITAALSTALSFEGKRKRATDHANIARALLFNLIFKHREKAESFGAYATWHSEVYAAGFFARVALGAKKSIAQEMFEEGKLRGEFDTGLQLEYVKFLARGKKAERAKAVIEAEKLIKAERNSPLDQYFITIGEGLLEALKAEDKKLLKKRLKTASLFVAIEDEKSEPTYKLDPWLIEYAEGLKE